MTGGQLAAGIGLAVLLAAVLGVVTSLAARAAAPHWARTDDRPAALAGRRSGQLVTKRARCVVA